jgi:hypothetical protein
MVVSEGADSLSVHVVCSALVWLMVRALPSRGRIGAALSLDLRSFVLILLLPRQFDLIKISPLDSWVSLRSLFLATRRITEAHRQLFPALPPPSFRLGYLYSGLVRRKNALSLLFMTISALGVVSFQWMFWGYSLTFSVRSLLAPSPSPLPPPRYVNLYSSLSFLPSSET